MQKNFEEEFMDIQSGLISLCLEAVKGKADKVYAYVSNEAKSRAFNAFFESKSKIKSAEKMMGRGVLKEFFHIGLEDIERMNQLCDTYGMKRPTELKMIYDVKSGKYQADYQYDEVCSAKTELVAHEVFLAWMDEVKQAR